MGGGPVENVLCILPAPEPKELLDQLRNKIPGLEIKYIEQKFGGALFQPVELPDSKRIVCMICCPSC